MLRCFTGVARGMPSPGSRARLGAPDLDWSPFRGPDDVEDSLVVAERGCSLSPDGSTCSSPATGTADVAPWTVHGRHHERAWAGRPGPRDARGPAIPRAARCAAWSASSGACGGRSARSAPGRRIRRRAPSSRTRSPTPCCARRVDVVDVEARTANTSGTTAPIRDRSSAPFPRTLPYAHDADGSSLRRCPPRSLPGVRPAPEENSCAPVCTVASARRASVPWKEFSSARYVDARGR